MVASLHDDALELPGYSSSVTPQRSTNRAEHVYFLENNKGRKWLSISVKSRSTSASSLPLYYEKDIITGRVELDLDKSETIKGVVVTVGITKIIG